MMNYRSYRGVLSLIKNGIILSIVLLSIKGVFAADGTEVSCASLPNSNSCTQCFDGGGLYAGWKYPLYDVVNNSTPNTQMIMYRDNRGSITFENLQYGLIDWNYPSIAWQEPSAFLWRIG